MGMFVFLNPANNKQRYWTISASDPGIPSGWVLTSGSDGGSDEHQQQFKAGVNSGGYPKYTNDAAQVAAQPNWPNGILGNNSGNKVVGR